MKCNCIKILLNRVIYYVFHLKKSILQNTCIYNECFYEMRKALDIVPYNFLSDYEQIKEKIKDIYLFMENSFCYGEYNILAKRIMNLLSCM